LPDAGAGAKVALIEIIAGMRALDYKPNIIAKTKDEDSAVRLAAMKGLEYLADEAQAATLLERRAAEVMRARS